MVVELRYCPHCETWSAILKCPVCAAKTRCWAIAEEWSELGENADLDGAPVACDECTWRGSVGDLQSEGHLSRGGHVVRFFVESER